MNHIQEHGSFNYQYLLSEGYNPQKILDFSININPYGVCPGVLKALKNLDPSSYPDPSVHKLKTQLATINNVGYDEVLIGNGAAELIWLIAYALLESQSVLIISPTFGEYARSAKIVKAKVYEYITQAPHFEIHLPALEQEINTKHPKYIILCNPNNPSGRFLVDNTIHHLASCYPESTIILDESYRSFVTETPFSPILADNIIHLRSMTKDFGLAGLRVGYVLAKAAIIQQLHHIQPPWSVNSAAQVATLAALEDLPYLERTLNLLKSEAETFKQQLAEANAKISPSSTHFFLIDVHPYEGRTYWEMLLKKGFHIRDCASFGLAHHVRISTRLPNQNQLFIKAWHLATRELLSQLKHENFMPTTKLL